MPAFKKKPLTKAVSGKKTVEDFVSRFKAALETSKHDPFQALQGAGVSSPLVIYSEDPHRLKRFLGWFRDQLSNVAIQNYFGGELTSASTLKPIIQSTNTLSLFSQYQLIIVHNVDAIKSALGTSLAQTINAAPPQTFFLLTVGKKELKSQLLSELTTAPTSISFQELSGDSLLRWVERESKLHSKGGITPEAVRVLVDIYGADTAKISHQLGKLSLLVSPLEAISEELVKTICLHTPEHTSFELIQMIAKKDALVCQLLTTRLLEHGFHPLQLCSFLSRAMRTILAHKSTTNSQTAEEAISSELTNPWFVRNLRGLFPLFSIGELRGSLELLKTLDFKLKDSKIADQTLLLTTVERLCLRSFLRQSSPL